MLREIYFIEAACCYCLNWVLFCLCFCSLCLVSVFSLVCFIKNMGVSIILMLIHFCFVLFCFGTDETATFASLGPPRNLVFDTCIPAACFSIVLEIPRFKLHYSIHHVLNGIQYIEKFSPIYLFQKTRALKLCDLSMFDTSKVLDDTIVPVTANIFSLPWKLVRVKIER